MKLKNLCYLILVVSTSFAGNCLDIFSIKDQLEFIDETQTLNPSITLVKPYEIESPLLSETITSISYRNKGIDTLSEKIHRLRDVNSVNLSGNNLKHVPDMNCLLKLDRLDLSKNELGLINGELFPPNLTLLALASNNIDSLDDSFSHIINLETLIVSTNNLSNLPASFEVFWNLEILYLLENEFEVFPEVIFTFAHIQYINLANNRLTSIPDEFDNTIGLKKIDLNSNSLIDLPNSLFDLSLTELKVDSNKLCALSTYKQEKLDLLSPGWQATQDCSDTTSFIKTPHSVKLDFEGAVYFILDAKGVLTAKANTRSELRLKKDSLISGSYHLFKKEKTKMKFVSKFLKP